MSTVDYKYFSKLVQTDLNLLRNKDILVLLYIF
jgi:hypothetical protein